MAAQAVPPTAGHRGVEAEQPSYRRVQAVGGDQVASRFAVHEQVVGPLVHGPYGAGLGRHAGVGEPGGERGLQRGASHPAARTAGEPGLRHRAAGPRVDVADAGERATVGRDAQGGEVGDRAGHQTLAARLVDRHRARLADDHVQARAGGVQGGRQADRAAAGDDEVTHAKPR